MRDIVAKLHSKYNPQAEARRYIDALKIDSDINCFILIEPGIGYMIPVLREDRPDSKIIVLHADACFRELPGVFQGDAVWYPDSGAGVQEFLETEVPLAARVRIVEWRPGLNVFGDIILNLVRESAEFIKRLEAGRRTGAFFGKRWVRNFFRNLALFQNTLLYRKMDIPVVITGSGPGLESVLSRILAVRESVFVLAASSSLQALAAGGITPDMAISTDGGGWALTHLYSFFRPATPRLFEKPRLPEKPPLLALSFCAAVPSQCSDIPLLPMNDGSLWQSIALHAIGFPSALIPQRGTVTASALELALELSNGRLFLAGMDLSVCDIRSHARPNALDPLLFGCASRLRPVYSQYFIRSGAIRAGGSLDVYAAWFKTRLGLLPKRIFSIGNNHEVFGGLAREMPFAGIDGRTEREEHFEPVKTADNHGGRPKRAAQAIITALGDPKYAPALIAELSPLLFPSQKNAGPREIAGALREIAKRYY
ncbi:MAG: DUF115 domain-containing protein, partial [Treponema sp.]|nr:DUF115 domain-containing protein [Treponema sp.]